MTDNEIVKGLEVCQNISGETCDDCPYEESKHLDEVMPNGLNYDQMSCDMWLQMDSLDLINRQKAEIAELESEIATLKHSNINLQELYYAQKEKVAKSKQKVIDVCRQLQTAKAEIERLNKEVETFADIGKMYSEIKAEAYREFDELLKDECLSYPLEKDDITMLVDVESYNNLLKELVGEGGQLRASVPTSKKEDCK